MPIDFVLVQLQDDDRIEERISIISSAAEHYGADFNLFGTLATLTWGTPGDGAPTGPRPRLLVAELARRFGNAAKLLQGSDLGSAGFTGGNRNMRFSIMIPRFSEARRRIETMDWGEIVDFAP